MDNSILVNANSKEIIKEVLFQESCEVNAEQDVKVLGASARSRVTGCESLNGEFRVNVKTTFNVLKRSADGNYFTEQAETESSHTIANEAVLPTTKAVLRANVTECSVNVGSTTVKCKATVEICGWFVKERAINYLNAGTPGIYCKSCETKIENVLPITDNKVTLTFTDETRMPLAQIIDFCGYVSIGSVYPASGSYRLDGDVNFRLTAITDNGQFLTQSFSHPFTADCMDENITSDMHLDMEGVLKNLSFTITESDKRIVVSDVSLTIYGIGIEEKEVNGVCDVYCTTNEIKVESSTQTVNSHFCLRSLREKATATVSVGSVSEVLTVTNPMLSVTGTRNADGVSIEGIVQTTVVYMDGADIKSCEAEIPYVSTIGADYVCESIFAPEVTVTAINARPRGGSEIEINVELFVVVRGVRTTETVVIGGLEFGEKKEEDDFAISLYIVKPNETLWEVAKALNTDEATLTEQNSDIELPLKGGEKIILYKQLNVE